MAFAAPDVRTSLPTFCAHQDCLDRIARDSPEVEFSHLTGKAKAPLTKHFLPHLQHYPGSQSRILPEALTLQAKESYSKAVLLTSISFSNSPHLLFSWLYQLLDKRNLVFGILLHLPPPPAACSARGGPGSCLQ